MAPHDVRASWIESELGAELRAVHDEQRPGWLRERSQSRDGVTHGLRETYSSDGNVLERWHYVAGREHGPYQRLSGLQIHGAFIEGRRNGRWFYRRPEDGSLAAEVDHRDGAVTTWRSYSAAGRQREAPPLIDDDDVDRWSRLLDAWEAAIAGSPQVHGYDSGAVHAAVDAWPAGGVARPVAWVRARLAAGDELPSWFVFEPWLAPLLDDPVDPEVVPIEVELSHCKVTIDACRRLARRASRVVELRLEEVGADDGLASLLPADAVWSSLRSVSIDECEQAPWLIPRLAASRIPELTSLSITQSFDARLLTDAPWLRTLEHLEVRSIDLAWLVARDLPRLVELSAELDSNDDLATSLRRLVDPARRPRLARVRLKRLPADVVLPALDGLEIVRAYG